MRSTRAGLAAGIAAACAVAIAIPAAAGTTPTHRNVHFTDTVVGAAISPTEAVLKVHDSVVGDGAGVQRITGLTATGGTDVTTIYYRGATAVAHDTFKLSAPDANGIITVTGTGKDVSGTGKFRHLRSTYTFTGTFRTPTMTPHQGEGHRVLLTSRGGDGGANMLLWNTLAVRAPPTANMLPPRPRRRTMSTRTRRPSSLSFAECPAGPALVARGATFTAPDAGNHRVRHEHEEDRRGCRRHRGVRRGRACRRRRRVTTCSPAVSPPGPTTSPAGPPRTRSRWSSSTAPSRAPPTTGRPSPPSSRATATACSRSSTAAAAPATPPPPPASSSASSTRCSAPPARARSRWSATPRAA